MCIDLDNQTITTDDGVKERLATQQPYRTWLNQKMLKPSRTHHFIPNSSNFSENEQKFMYTKSEYVQELLPLIQTHKEAIGSFPYTPALNFLQKRPQLFFDFFKQNFAQVTNPPLDSIRETSVFSLKSMVTSITSIHDEPLEFPIYEFESPILSRDQFEVLVSEKLFHPITISLGYDTGLKEAVQALKNEIQNVVKQGTKLIILDQEAQGKVMPSLMATAIAHDKLVELGKRLEVRLVIKTGDARLPIHHAMLLAYGADVIYPYFCYEYLMKKV